MLPDAPQKIIVTGGSGGIGAFLVQLLRQKGHHVIIVGARERPDEPLYLQADLSSQDGILDAADQIRALAPDMLINLAGRQFFGPLEDQGVEDLVADQMVNLVAPMLLTRAVLPGMKARGRGRIVNIGSVYGAIPFAHFVGYSSAKAGLAAFSQALGRELDGTGVRVTHVAPRGVRTAFNGPLVRSYAAMTRMVMDDPAKVAARIVAAIDQDKAHVTIGGPERLFTRLNALFPALISRAVADNDRKARSLFNNSPKNNHATNTILTEPTHARQP